MALIGINPVQSDPRKPTTLEQIAQGVDIASKVVGGGLDFYKTVAMDKPQGEADIRLKNAQAKYYEAGGPRDSFMDYLKAQTMKKELAKPSLSPAQEAVDKAFAGDYQDFVASGGFADVEKNLDQLRQASAMLQKSKNATTGPAIGLVPKIARDVVAPESAALQDSVEEAVQRNLRLILGAQFTEKEGTKLIERAYNPRLSPEENKKRVDRMVRQIESAAKAKASAARYYESNGTLKGFKGKIPTSIDDILPADKEEKMLNQGNQGAGGGENKQQKPKTIMQNGHIYNLNEKTGEYE